LADARSPFRACPGHPAARLCRWRAAFAARRPAAWHRGSGQRRGDPDARARHRLSRAHPRRSAAPARWWAARSPRGQLARRGLSREGSRRLGHLDQARISLRKRRRRVGGCPARRREAASPREGQRRQLPQRSGRCQNLVSRSDVGERRTPGGADRAAVGLDARGRSRLVRPLDRSTPQRAGFTSTKRTAPAPFRVERNEQSCPTCSWPMC
jgi:hypothetical protein